jgi:hypothetical protein
MFTRDEQRERGDDGEEMMFSVALAYHSCIVKNRPQLWVETTKW